MTSFQLSLAAFFRGDFRQLESGCLSFQTCGRIAVSEICSPRISHAIPLIQQ